MKKPKIIFWDVETSPIITANWRLYTNFITLDNLLEDWNIICAAWKVAGEKTVHKVAVDPKNPSDDYKVVKAIRNAIGDADMIVHHNGDKFDLKKLNARLIIHQLPPLPPILTLDTKKEAKKVAEFTSNKLEYLATVATGAGKIHVDYQLWLRVRAGDRAALKEMVDYNIVDVLKLEEVYNWLRPYIKNHPHIWSKQDDNRHHKCDNCGSTDLKRNGIRPTKAGILKQEVQCKKCGSYKRIPILKNEK